jgi:hypothetical protein
VSVKERIPMYQEPITANSTTSAIADGHPELASLIDSALQAQVESISALTGAVAYLRERLSSVSKAEPLSECGQNKELSDESPVRSIIASSTIRINSATEEINRIISALEV